MNQEFMSALSEIEATKKIKKEVLLETLEQALIAAYKKNYGHSQNVVITIDRQTGEISVVQQKTVVEEVYDTRVEIGLSEAQQIDKRYEVGDVVDFKVIPKNFGRIAAQTAKQVVVQRIKEAERDNLMDMYRDSENGIVSGVVLRNDAKGVYVQVNNDTEAILPNEEQLEGEGYGPGARLKFYVTDVKKTANNPQIVLSRTHPGLVKKLFEQEVPEIMSGVVEIKTIAREPGSRSKISVLSNDENVDAVGSCVGPRGTRVQIVCDELGGEKIDIVKYFDDPAKFISEALSPSEVLSVDVNEEAHSAHVVVPAHQLSLAIGKEGQNARLAARLTGWKIDIKPDNEQ